MTGLANLVSATVAGLGETGGGSAVEVAVAAVIQEGDVRTCDMGGKDSTLDMAKAIAGKL